MRCQELSGILLLVSTPDLVSGCPGLDGTLYLLEVANVPDETKTLIKGVICPMIVQTAQLLDLSFDSGCPKYKVIKFRDLCKTDALFDSLCYK